MDRRSRPHRYAALFLLIVLQLSAIRGSPGLLEGRMIWLLLGVTHYEYSKPTNSVQPPKDEPPSSSVSQPEHSLHDVDDVSSEDRAVLGVALEAEAKRRAMTTLLLSSRTGDAMESEEIQSAIDENPAVAQAIEDYKRRNVTSVDITSIIGSSVVIRIVSKGHIDEVFREDPGGAWSRLRKEFGEFLIVEVTRPGFSRDRLTAVLYVGIGCSPRCGEGNLLLLSKKSGAWKATSRINILLS